ncbi:hypothetical protein ACS0TY_032838 [Phlomoides rotata]
MKVSDTGGVLEYLQQRQLDNPNFFYAIQVDQNDLIANILWVDAQMKIDYAYFDMTTTQRNESMNSVLKRYVSYKHNLLQFCQHFNILVSDRRYEELKADYRSSHTIPVASFPVQILKHAINVYTHEVLKLFEDELNKAYDAEVDLCGQAPELYIKKRWTKKAKKNIVEGRSNEVRVEPSTYMNEDEEKKLIGVHYKELCSLYNKLTTRGALTTNTFEIAKKYVVKGIEEIDACLENTSFVRPTVAKSVV